MMQTKKITSYNEYLLEILNITNPDKAEEQLQQILQLNPRLFDIYKRALDPMTHSVRKDMSIKLLQNKTIDVQINALCLTEEPDKKNVIFYIKNLAMIQELEQNLNRSMKYTIISQLASSIGHEVRNPLSSLAIHTEVLNNLTSELPDEYDNSSKIQKSLGILNSEIGRITKLIDQFFNLARNEEVRLSLENVNDVVRKLLNWCVSKPMKKAWILKFSWLPDYHWSPYLKIK